jgi:hypothetical protein
MAESASDPRNHEVHGDVHLFFCARLPARGDLAMSQRAAERARLALDVRERRPADARRGAPWNGLGSRSMSVNAVLRVPGAAARRRAARANDWAAPPAADDTLLAHWQP